MNDIRLRVPHDLAVFELVSSAVVPRESRGTMMFSPAVAMTRGSALTGNRPSSNISPLRGCDRPVLERVICAHGTSPASADEVQGLPSGPTATVRQASLAVEAGRKRGIDRQILELPWPLSGASELDDWYASPHVPTITLKV